MPQTIILAQCSNHTIFSLYYSFQLMFGLSINTQYLEYKLSQNQQCISNWCIYVCVCVCVCVGGGRGRLEAMDFITSTST